MKGPKELGTILVNLSTNSITKTLVRKLERILIRLYKQNVSLLFNQTCLNEGQFPTTHTHTHTHTHTYIYIYININRILHEIKFNGEYQPNDIKHVYGHYDDNIDQGHSIKCGFV